jgi:hypothetical protein
MQLDPAARPSQPGLDPLGVMVTGIIQSAFGQRELTRPNAVQTAQAHAGQPGASVRVHVKPSGALHQQCVRAASAAQRDLPKADKRIPLRVGAETYAAFRSVASTAKANRASVLDTVRFVISAKQSGDALVGVG